MTENQFTYSAFLSLSQLDNRAKRPEAQDADSLCWGDWLHHELKTFSIPAVYVGQINARGETIAEHLDPVFQDQEEQTGNDRLNDAVRQALEQSRCLIVICSPRSAKSLLVNEQVRYFKQLGRGNRILPIVIAGEPNASEGHKPGRSPEEECFVPALRHPLAPDGTLDVSRRERNSIFADARQGDARLEIMAKDLQDAEMDLETAKVQLIAGLLGVGFNGLWGHELKRRFTAAHLLARAARPQNQDGRIPNQEAQSQLLEAQREAREALGQVVEARNESRAAEAKVLETQQLAQEAQAQLAEARQQLSAAQNQVLAAQNAPSDVPVPLAAEPNMLPEAQNQAREAQAQADAARRLALELEEKLSESQHELSHGQSRIQEIEVQARQTQRELEAAQKQAWTAEANTLETQQRAQETEDQLEALRQELRAAQHQVLEVQNLPQDVKRRIEEVQGELQAAQDQARTAKREAAEARKQAQDLANEIQESQNQVAHAHSQVRESEIQARETQDQLAQAQSLANAAESKVLAMQQQVRDAENKLAQAHEQARDLEHKFQESQAQATLAQSQVREIDEVTRRTQNQLAEAQGQASAAESKVLALQQLVRDTENKLAEAHQQAQDLANKFQESQAPATLAQSQVREIDEVTRRTQNQLAEAQSRAATAEGKVLETQQQVHEIQDQSAAAQQQSRELANQVLESQNQLAHALSRVQELESHARQAQGQLVEAQNQARAAENQVLEARNKIQQIESQNQAAQAQIQAVQSQAAEAQAQVRFAKNQVLELQHKNVAAGSRTKVLAVMTVLALLAAGTSLLPRKQATPAPTTPTPPATEPEVTTGPLNREQIRQALQKVSGGDQEVDRRRSLDDLAARIPPEEISNTLGTSSAILAGPSLSHFQGLLLDGWMKTNLPAAFAWSCLLTDTNSRQRALEKIIPALVADNPTNTLARLNDLKPAPGDQTYLLFFQRWAATAPVQAIEQRRQTPGHDDDAEILSAIMTVWVAQQPAAALNWLESQPDSASLPTGTWRDTMMATLFNLWAEKDLEAATTACQQLPEGPAKEKAWERVLNQRIVTLPSSAAGSVTNLAPGDYRQKAIAELSRHWAETNAPAAMAWAPTLPTETERIAATNQIMASWAGTDPQAASQFASQHPELSGAVLGDIAAAWSQRDLSATTNWVASLPDGERKDTVLLALASSTTARAPLLAAKLCTLLTTNQPTAEQYQGIAASLAQVDFTNALAWACSLKEDSARQAALSALSEPWAQNDPQGMATYAVGLPPGDEQTQLLTAACRQLSRRDFPGMVALLEPLFDEELRQNILEQAGRDCDLLHVDQMEKCISTMPAGDDQQAALKGLLSNWTAADPEAAVNWLVNFPETNAQPQLVQGVIKAWARLEPAAAAQWLTNSPTGTPSDDLQSAFLEGALVKYPAYAADWTQSVTNETQRQKFQVQVARQWLKTDASAATNWIDSLNLPAEIKQSLKAQ